MGDVGIISLLGEQRRRAGLSQAALASRVGVSRQAIIAIEAGRQVPSTALSLLLARALGCGVDDLFRLRAAAHLDGALATDDAAATPGGDGRVVVGRVDGTWAAHRLAADVHRAADGLLHGVAADMRGTVQPLVAADELARNVLVAGCAPLLGVLASRLGRRYRDARATWVPANSRRALDLLADGLVHIAGLHLVGDLHGDLHGSAHEGLARQRFPGRSTLVINLTRWRQGLLVAAGNPLGIRSVADLARPDVRVARREPGAGADKLITGLLRAAGLGVEALGDGPVVTGHAAVAGLVRWGAVDAGVAIESVALGAGLGFVPLSEERFDLIVPADRGADGPVARLLGLLDQPAFRAEAARLPGYDLSISGHTTTVEAVSR